jgi:hypothetical protein
MLTPEQIRAIKLLSRCTFLPASYDKRFVRSMVAKLHDPEPLPLTARQHTVLMEKVHRYRRQHGQCTCLECLEEAMEKDNPYQGKLFEEERMR